MLEKSIESKMKAALEARGALVYKFVSPGNRGVPDRLVVLPGGRCVFVELKQDSGRLEELQKWQRSRLQEQGAEVHVVRGSKDVPVLLHLLFPPHASGGEANGV